MKMKWMLILLLGTLAETTVGWKYHLSKTPMNWTRARQWCQSEHTDMVVIQNQAENDYLVSSLPIKTRGPYYWIGITKKHMNETWTWIGNNSTWIGNQSWAPNEPNNNHITEFCVEIYANKGTNRGKWNDEKCATPKYPVCYEAQCNETSCDRGRCQETINNITCLCEPGFKGNRCQTAVECPPLSQPDNGYLSCSGENLTFNSSCPSCASYKQALLAVAGCAAVSAFCGICFCWMKRRKRKKLAQVRQPEEATSPSTEAQG